jgi:hypothetical protein
MWQEDVRNNHMIFVRNGVVGAGRFQSRLKEKALLC